MFRRIIRPAPVGIAPVLSQDNAGNSTNGLTFVPDESKVFYARYQGVMTAFQDYITEDAAPVDAIYVCELQGNEYVETLPQAAVDFSTAHNYAGWPMPNGADADLIANAYLNEDGSVQYLEDGSPSLLEVGA